MSYYVAKIRSQSPEKVYNDLLNHPQYRNLGVVVMTEDVKGDVSPVNISYPYITGGDKLVAVFPKDVDPASTTISLRSPVTKDSSTQHRLVVYGEGDKRKWFENLLSTVCLEGEYEIRAVCSDTVKNLIKWMWPKDSTMTAPTLHLRMDITKKSPLCTTL